MMEVIVFASCVKELCAWSAQEVGAKLAMHIVAARPLALDRQSIPAEAVAGAHTKSGAVMQFQSETTTTRSVDAGLLFQPYPRYALLSSFTQWVFAILSAAERGVLARSETKVGKRSFAHCFLL